MTTIESRGRWTIIALIFVAIMLNYVDRQILALLKPTLEAQFGWQAAFLLAGGLGLIWVVVWMAVRVAPVAIDAEEPAPVRWLDIVRKRDADHRHRQSAVGPSVVLHAVIAA